MSIYNSKVFFLLAFEVFILINVKGLERYEK
jgi:hypothetical protein